MNRNRLHRRSFLKYSAMGATGASAFALVGCGGDDDDTEEPGGSPEASATSGGETPGGDPSPANGSGELAASQVLRTRFYFDLLPLDPVTIFGIEQENTATAVYNGLTKYDGETNLVSDLAESWEQADETTWVFNLHPEVAWQRDYGTLTAEDVVASYQRVIESGGQYAAEFDLISSIEAVDETTVRVLLSSPDANFGHQVSNYHQGSVINVRAVDELGDAHWLAPVGTGPFTLEDVRPGQGFLLNRFDGYFLGPATLEQIDMRTISDQATAAIAIANDELDVCMALRSEPDLATVLDRDNLGHAIGDQWGISIWMFNTTIPALADPRARKAMAYAMDIPAAVSATAPLTQTPVENIIPPWMPEYTDNVPKYPLDLNEARALLEAIDLPDGFTAQYMNLGNPNEFLTLLQASLSQVGINLEFDVADRAQFNQRRVSGDFDITGRGFPSANVNQLLFGYLHPDNIVPVGFNSSRYDNPVLTEKLEAAGSELDPEARLALYHEVQQIAMDDLPYLPYGAANEYWIFNKRVTGLKVNHMPQGNWYDLAILAD